MIPKAREVRLKPKVRQVLEARCRAPTTAQCDVRRARIVLLAADGRSTRSIAEEVGVQPRIVSNWRRRFADHGLGGLKDRPRAGKKPIYGEATNKRILALLDKPPPQGYARWTGPLLAKALGDVDGRSPRGGRARRYYPRHAGLPVRCGSCLQLRSVAASKEPATQVVKNIRRAPASRFFPASRKSFDQR
jgi:transposase